MTSDSFLLPENTLRAAHGTLLERAIAAGMVDADYGDEDSEDEEVRSAWLNTLLLTEWPEVLAEVEAMPEDKRFYNTWYWFKRYEYALARRGRTDHENEAYLMKALENAAGDVDIDLVEQADIFAKRASNS